MKKYVYHENNSGGYFMAEPPHTITVYADNTEEADSKAMTKGAYFDGVDTGMDCGCCGDRWLRAYMSEWE